MSLPSPGGFPPTNTDDLLIELSPGFFLNKAALAAEKGSLLLAFSTKIMASFSAPFAICTVTEVIGFGIWLLLIQRGT